MGGISFIAGLGVSLPVACYSEVVGGQLLVAAGVIWRDKDRHSKQVETVGMPPTNITTAAWRHSPAVTFDPEVRRDSSTYIYYRPHFQVDLSHCPARPGPTSERCSMVDLFVRKLDGVLSISFNV